MSERDPRLDPKPGDVLRGGKSERYVGLAGLLRGRACVGFTYWRLGVEHGMGNDACASLDTWRKWARNAEVVSRGE